MQEKNQGDINDPLTDDYEVNYDRLQYLENKPKSICDNDKPENNEGFVWNGIYYRRADGC